MTTPDNRLFSFFARFIAPLEVSIAERLQLLLLSISLEVLQPFYLSTCHRLSLSLELSSSARN